MIAKNVIKKCNKKQREASFCFILEVTIFRVFTQKFLKM